MRECDMLEQGKTYRFKEVKEEENNEEKENEN